MDADHWKIETATCEGPQHLFMARTWSQTVMRVRGPQALKLFPAIVIVPTMQLSWTLFSIVSGMAFFQEYRAFTPVTGAAFALGVLVHLWPDQAHRLEYLSSAYYQVRIRQMGMLSIALSRASTSAGCALSSLPHMHAGLAPLQAHAQAIRC